MARTEYRDPPRAILVKDTAQVLSEVDRLIAELDTPPAKGKAYTTPVSSGEYVLVSYIESDYYLIALDKDGDQKWTFPAGK